MKKTTIRFKYELPKRIKTELFTEVVQQNE